MARFGIPMEVDEYFFIGTLLVFLMINFDKDLASIYNHMMVYVILMYLTPFLFGFFKWVPISKKGSNKLVSTAIGVGVGYAFMLFYTNVLVGATSLQQVFAATAFGESELIGKLVFGVIIPIIETIFFFRILLQWLVYLLGWSSKLEPFSFNGQIVALGISGIFTIFHATAKGVSNNTALAGTFIFGYVSVMLVLYFKEVWHAIIMHVAVNAKSVGLVEMLFTGSVTLYAIIGGVIIYYLIKRGTLA